MGAGGNNAPFGCGDDRGLEDFEEGSGAEVGELCRRDADVCGVVEAYSKPVFALGRAGSLQLGLGYGLLITQAG